MLHGVSLGADHQSRYHRAWRHLAVPLRPHRDVVHAVSAEIGPQPGRTLLLGVTPELADIARDLTAVDRNLSMVRHVWPGNSAARRAIVGDWRNCNFTDGAFDLCVGDGSLNMVRFPDEAVQVCDRLRQVLAPGGKVVCRIYVSQPGDSIRRIAAAAMAGEIGGFHAFKMLLGMAIAAETGGPNVPVQSVLDWFQKLFPDRADLVRRTGWDRAHIDTIDFYAGSSAAMAYPTEAAWRSALSAALPDMRLVASGSYEFAERCPLLVATRA